MAVDLAFPVREAVVAFLRAQGQLTALIAPARIFGQLQPPNTPYPFVRFGTPSGVPLEYTCVNGATVTADLHVFSENEDEAHAIASELVTVLDDTTINLDPAGSLIARWTASQNMPDLEEPDVWHMLRTFDFEASL